MSHPIPENDRACLMRLLDIEALKRHKALYGHLIDSNPDGFDAAALAKFEGLFAEDAVGDYGWTVLRGRAAIRDFFAGPALERRAWCWHSFHDPIIEVDGDRAEARWTFYALSAPRSDPTNAKPTYGRCRDQYVRTSSGWRLTALTLANETR